MSSDDRRIEQLDRRVGWLDRHRRLSSLGLAGIAAPLAIWWLTGWLPAQWPQIHTVALCVMLGVVIWYVIELGLVWLTAMWETECAGLRRSRLPRAIAVDRRK